MSKAVPAMTRRLTAIPVASIDVPDDTLRALDPAWAEALGQMMAEAGQAQPIEVAAAGDRHVLVFGLHRLEGARRAGFKTIDALIDEADGDATVRRRRAIEENLFRRELSHLDRSVHIAAFHALRREEVGERRGGKRGVPRVSDQKRDDCVFGLSEEIAEKVGLSPRTVDEALYIVRRIGPAVRKTIVRSERLVRIADRRAELLRLAAGPEAGEDGREPTAAEREAWQLAILRKIEDGEADDVTGATANRPLEKETSRRERLAWQAIGSLPKASQERVLDEIEPIIRRWAQKRGWTMPEDA